MDTSSTKSSSTSPISTTSSSAIIVSVDTVPPRTLPFWPLREDWGDQACQTSLVTSLLAVAPEPVDAPVVMGTMVTLDGEARFLDRDLIAGGAPWRLLHLPGGSRTVAERWVGGGEVQAGEERFARTLVQQGLLHPLYRSEANVDDVDVVVPVHNDVDALFALLESLQGLHVTVVDDASSEVEAV